MACAFPKAIRLPDGGSQVVRCGKCLDCLSYRQACWISRLRQELKSCPDGCYFLTLTYNDESLPTMEVEPGKRLPCISSQDIRKLNMDVRRRFQQGYYYDSTLAQLGLSKVKLQLPSDVHYRYYITSEYGPQTHRPHYHGFLASLPEDEDLVFDLFDQCWNKGFITLEKASSEACAAYVTKYLVNNSLVPPQDPRLPKPRAWISKGVGASYLDNSRLVDWHRSAPVERQFVPNQDKKAMMPRYWRDRIFDDDMKAQVREAVEEREAARVAQFAALGPLERLEFLDDKRHSYDESLRQAEWHFRKRGKLK